MGYHQLEVDPESRVITTFSTHAVLISYKHLLFGVKSVAERYQYAVKTALVGILGVENISDDIIIQTPNAELHNKRLRQGFDHLQERGLTPNAVKCQYMDRLVFMGISLSENWISPTEGRVRGMAEARDPGTQSEFHSFLVLANNSARLSKA